ncbi:hypothetical protein, partial [Pantoea ananatis]
HLLRNKPVAFVLQEGGKVSHPRELTAVSDRGDEPRPTHLRREGRQLIGWGDEQRQRSPAARRTPAYWLG